MPNCIIVTGNIGCGKTTLSHKYVKKGYMVVSRDQLRYGLGNGKYIFTSKTENVIWKVELFLFEELLKSGLNLFVDETGINRKMRKRYIKIVQHYRNYKIISIELPRLSQTEAVANRLKLNHGSTKKEVWNSVWRNFDYLYEAPKKQEGFHQLIKL